MPSVGFGEIAFLLGVVIVVFGAKRIPDIARGLGSGIRNFKGSLKAAREDDSSDGDEPDG